MPVAHSRRFRLALWLAVATLVIPVVVSIADLIAGSRLAWLRLAALTVVAVTLGVSIRRQAAFEHRLVEKEQLDAALRASQAQFAGILGIAADAIISVDERQRIVHFNRGAEEIFGRAAADAVGRELSILLPARFRGQHPTHMANFAASDVVARRMGERREIFGLRADGTEFPAEASISKLSTPDGLLFSVVLRDITARKRAETDERFLAETGAALGHSLHVRATMQTVADLPVPYLADAALVDVTAAHGTFVRAATKPGSADGVLSTDASRAAALAAIAAAAPSAESPWPGIDVVRRQRPETVPLVSDDWLEGNEEGELVPHWRALGVRELLILPLVSGDRALGALTLIRLHDGRSLAEAQPLAEKFAAAAATAIENARLYELAQHAMRARDDVLGVVSHDLRNPISAITMCASTLQERPPAAAADRDALLVSIRESTGWINRLIQDLVDVVSIEQGRLSLDREARDAAEIVLQARHMFELEATQNGVTLDVSVPTNLPLITADGARLVQVLGNLLRNAIKFTPEGGRITLSARPGAGGFVTFLVRDTGVGIPLENQARVFDRYWESSTGARTQGSGLGLSIAKGIVAAHGGDIAVQSAPGAGTTFTFSIPAVDTSRRSG